MYQYILFDLDGTLTEPAQGITRCVQYALASFGIQSDTEELKKFIGPPLKQSFMNFYHFNEKDAETAVKKYRERFTDIGIFENHVFDGIKEMLGQLKNQDKKIALATSKPGIYAIRILERYELLPYFDIVVGSELNGNRTDKAEVIQEVLQQFCVSDENKQNVVMVGDRSYDIEGAKKNNIAGIGVSYGYAIEKELEESGALLVLDSVQELSSWLLSH